MCAIATSHSPRPGLYEGRKIKWRLVLASLLFLSNLNLFSLQSGLLLTKFMPMNMGGERRAPCDGSLYSPSFCSTSGRNSLFIRDELLLARSNCACASVEQKWSSMLFHSVPDEMQSGYFQHSTSSSLFANSSCCINGYASSGYKLFCHERRFPNGTCASQLLEECWQSYLDRLGFLEQSLSSITLCNMWIKSKRKVLGDISLAAQA